MKNGPCVAQVRGRPPWLLHVIARRGVKLGLGHSIRIELEGYDGGELGDKLEAVVRDLVSTNFTVILIIL